jgi:pyrimidine operon attenuation protein/uracil phosphoribosyltransferase
LSSKRNTNKEIEISDIDIFSSRSLNNKSVIVFDDVVDSGQTLMYAVSYLTSFNPNKIQTDALIDRNHRKFPNKVDYVGLQVATTLHENVVVEFDESNPENSCAFLQ